MGFIMQHRRFYAEWHISIRRIRSERLADDSYLFLFLFWVLVEAHFSGAEVVGAFSSRYPLELGCDRRYWGLYFVFGTLLFERVALVGSEE